MRYQKPWLPPSPLPLSLSRQTNQSSLKSRGFRGYFLVLFWFKFKIENCAVMIFLVAVSFRVMLSILTLFQNHRVRHPPVYVSQQAAHQLSSPSQPPLRLPNDSPKYLVTSPGSAHVRFQSPYQGSPSQTAGFFHR